MNVIDDESLQLIPQNDDPVAENTLVPLAIIVTLLPRTTKGIDDRIATDENRRVTLESVMVTEFASVEPVTLTWISSSSSKFCPLQISKLLDIVTEACSMSQVVVFIRRASEANDISSEFEAKPINSGRVATSDRCRNSRNCRNSFG
jgi:hypothetical protein